jgi:succinate dehydrogenase / fumarate reductase membrane anchor subunit
MVRRQAIGAHYGLRDWLMQRITGLVIALYVLWLVFMLLTGSLNLGAWQELSGHTWFKLVTFLMLVSVFLHAWVGMRDIIMDYIRAAAVRLVLEVLVAAALVVYTGWAIQILWGYR